MKTSYDMLRAILRTEKGSRQEGERKYFFRVASRANKIEVKQAVEEIYKVKVDNVHTITMKGKLKRVRREAGRTSDWKKAIVTLKEGQKIEVAA